MTDSNGLIPELWKTLSFGKVSPASSLNAEQLALYNVITAAISEAFLTAYSTNSGDVKTKHIIDLIISRFDNVIDDSYSTLIEQYLTLSYFDNVFENAKNSILNHAENYKNIDRTVEYISLSIYAQLQTFYTLLFDGLIDELTKKFSVAVESPVSAPESPEELPPTNELLDEPLTPACITKALDSLTFITEYILKSISPAYSEIDKIISNTEKSFLILAKKLDKKMKDISKSLDSSSQIDAALKVAKKLKESTDTLTPSKKAKKLQDRIDNLIMNMPNDINTVTATFSEFIHGFFPMVIETLLTSHDPRVKKFWNKVMLAGMEFLFSTIIAILFANAGSLKEIFGPVIDNAIKIKDAFVETFKTVFNKIIMPFVKFFKDSIWPHLSYILLGIADIVEHVAMMLFKHKDVLFELFIDIAKEVAHNVMLFFKGICANDYFTGLKSLVLSVADIFKNFFNGLVSMKSVAKLLFSDMATTFFAIVKDVADGFKSTYGEIFAKLTSIKDQFGKITNDFLIGYTKYLSENLSITDQYLNSLKEFLGACNKIKETFDEIGMKFDEIIAKFYDGVGEWKTTIDKLLLEYMNTCSEIDRKYGLAVKDGGESLGELQGKILKGIIALVGMGDGSVYSIIEKASILSAIDFICFWRDSKLPTVEDLEKAGNKLSDKAYKTTDKLRSNFNDFKYTLFSPTGTKKNMNLPDWLEHLEWHTRNTYNKIARFILYSTGKIPKSTYLRIEDADDTAYERNVIGVLDKLYDIDVFNDLLNKVLTYEKLLMEIKSKHIDSEIKLPSANLSTETTSSQDVSKKVDIDTTMIKEFYPALEEMITSFFKLSKYIKEFEQESSENIINLLKNKKTLYYPIPLSSGSKNVATMES